MSLNSVPKELNSILTDNKSGSRELLENLHNYFSNHKEEINLKLISFLSQHLTEFQSVQKYLTELKTAFESDSLNEFFTQVESKSKNIYKEIYAGLKPEIDLFNSFITISNSKTILEVLKLASKEKHSLGVVVSEGRPVCEGQILAEKFASENITVSLITEAQIFDAVQKVHCGIIGADKILPSGNVVNKVGSNLLAVACREFSKPLFVIADKSKLSSDNSFEKVQKPAGEIFNASSDNIEIENFYFEEVSNEFITKIVTD